MRDTTAMRNRTGRDTSMAGMNMSDSTHHRRMRTARRGRHMRAGTDTSQTRIPVTKNTASSGGEVTTRVDTVTVTRVDTVATTRTDTVTVTKTDTVQLQPPPRFAHYPEGLYFGVGGGVSLPTGSMYTPNATGLSGQGQLGWKSFTMPLGVRVDANYLRDGQDSHYSWAADDGQVWNFNGDVTLNLPTHMFGLSPRFNIYLLGGPSYTRWRDVFIDATAGNPGLPPANATYSRDWQSKWGWNAGGGASLSFGRTEIFAESRLISFTVPYGTSAARQVPFIVGFNLFSGAISRQIQ